MTFVWLFGALVSMRAIDYDLQENFWDLAVYGKVFEKIFHGRAPPGDGRSSTSSVVRSGKNQIWRDTGQITQRFRLVIMAILEVFGMDRSRGESVWVELERYGALVNTNHGNLCARRIRDQLTNSGNHNLLGLPPEAPTMPAGWF